MDRSRSPSPTTRTPTSPRNSPRTTAAQSPPVGGTAQGPQPEAAPEDGTPAPIDQPLPNADPHARPLVSVTPSPGLVLSTPVPERSLEPVKGFNAAALQHLLATWPQPQPCTPAPPTHSATPSQQTVATAAVQHPFLFVNLPLDLQRLVLGLVLGEPEHVHEAAQAAQLLCTYGRWLRVSHPVQQLTLTYRQRVLLCTMRLPPLSQAQLQLMPVHDLLGVDPANIAPITVLEHLVQALSGLRTDEQACHAALALGRQLLQATLSPGITPATQRALLCVPQLIVRALRTRLHNEHGNAYAITCTLRELMHWAVLRGPTLALPLLFELLFTVGQVEINRQSQMLNSREASLCTSHVENAIYAVCVQQTMPMTLVGGLYGLIDLVPTPWSTQVPASPPDRVVTAALAFLADYPHAFVGFAREVLACLRELPLNGEQQALMQRCLQRLAAPLDLPKPAPEQ